MSNMKKFLIENKFYETVSLDRFEKVLMQLEIFKIIKNVKGCILEFGIFRGNSFIRFMLFNKIYNFKKKFYGFDTFGEFPKGKNYFDNLQRNKFTKSAGTSSTNKLSLNRILKKKKLTNFTLIKGDVLATLPKFIRENKNLQISLINLDLDLYEPSKIVLESLYPRLSKNGIIILDNYKTFYGETKAVNEFCKKHKIKLQKFKLLNKKTFIIKK